MRRLQTHCAPGGPKEVRSTQGQAPEFRKYLEQPNSAQGDILNRLRTLPASPAGDDTLVKRLAWQTCIGLGILEPACSKEL
jgi:hypothetical protein